MRKKVCFFISLFLIVYPVLPLVSAETLDYKLYIDNELINIQTPLQRINNIFYCSAKDLGVGMGLEVNWVDDIKQITFASNNITLQMKVNNYQMVENGFITYCDFPPIIINNIVFVSPHAIVRQFGGEAYSDDTHKSYMINYKDKVINADIIDKQQYSINWLNFTFFELPFDDYLDLEVDVSLTKNDLSAPSGKLLFVLYDSENQLEIIYTLPDPLGIYETKIVFGDFIVHTTDTEQHNVKVFMWDELNGLQPVSNAIGTIIPQFKLEG